MGSHAGAALGVVDPLTWVGSRLITGHNPIQDLTSALTPKIPSLPTVPAAPATATPPTLADAHQVVGAPANVGVRATAAGTIGASGPQGLVDKAQTTNLTLLGGSK